MKIVSVNLFLLTLFLTNATLIGSSVFSINVVDIPRPRFASRVPQFAGGYRPLLNVIHKNGLPPSVSFASLSAFRRTIQKVDFSQLMKCT